MWVESMMTKNKLASTGLALLISAGSLIAPVKAQDADGSIYEPLVDRDTRGFKEAKYQKDLAFCRSRAAPQEGAARAGAQQAEAGEQQISAGSALSVLGGVVSSMPVGNLGAARGLWAGGNAAGATGSAVAAQGAATASQGAARAGMAAQDYALVINACLQRRGYVLLR